MWTFSFCVVYTKSPPLPEIKNVQNLNILLYITSIVLDSKKKEGSDNHNNKQSHSFTSNIDPNTSSIS